MVLDIERVIADSYKNFHTRGFDYICLYRSPEWTQKIYTFDGDVAKLPEVINPHDHRYDFTTTCLYGAVENRWYNTLGHKKRDPVYQKFEYRTPLNGGNGFSWVGEQRLRELRRETFRPGLGTASYGMGYNEIHTIKICRSGTILGLNQYADIVPLDKPTTTYCHDSEPPSLTGLYDKFTADEILKKLAIVKEKVPAFELPVM